MFPAPQPPSQPAPNQGQRPAFPSSGAQGQQAPDRQQVLAMYAKQIQDLAESARKIMETQAIIDPEGQALLVPIAQAGKALEARAAEIGQRAQAGPGAPGGQEAMSAQSPAPNPSEGAPVPMAAA